jgi:hypothetical protein
MWKTGNKRQEQAAGTKRMHESKARKSVKGVVSGCGRMGRSLNAALGVSRSANRNGALSATMGTTIGATISATTAFLLLAGAVGVGMLLTTSEARAQQSDAVKELAAPPPIQLPLKPSPEFAKFPRYAGMLGKRQIVLRLGPKTDDPSGVHGEYQFTDTGEVILIAGDRDGDTLEVEESNDGTHITGNWVGKFAADGSVAGDRMNVDDSDPQGFDLRPLAAGQPVPPPGPPAKPSTADDASAAPSAGTPPAAPAAQPAQSASGAHTVNGVSNLNTGE